MTSPLKPKRARTLLLAACALAGGAAVAACDTGTDATPDANDASDASDASDGFSQLDGANVFPEGGYDAGGDDATEASDDAPSDAPDADQ